MSLRDEVLREFAEAAQLGRRREHLTGYLFSSAPVVDSEETWRRSVHTMIGALVARHKLKPKWRSKL